MIRFLHTYCLIALLFFYSFLNASEQEAFQTDEFVISTKQIALDYFPHAFNPSIIQHNEGYLLTFRYWPDRYGKQTLAHIGLVLLDQNFEPISEPQLLRTREKNSKTLSQSEDARIFSYKGRLFLIYNDNVDVFPSTIWERRDMFIAELSFVDNRFVLSTPLKLCYDAKYQAQLWQKNWIPFEWNGTLLLAYSMNPHEIIYPNLLSGHCYPCYDSWSQLDWKWGTLRGSTPPKLIDGEYLAFFHSGMITSSSSSWGIDLWHYFMGAYTFSSSPPFQITKISSKPIVGENFYTQSTHEKRVIFPGGFVISDPYIYVAYGKDDCEIWIATLDKNLLMKSLVPVNQ